MTQAGRGLLFETGRNGEQRSKGCVGRSVPCLVKVLTLKVTLIEAAKLAAHVRFHGAAMRAVTVDDQSSINSNDLCPRSGVTPQTMDIDGCFAG